MSKITAKHFLNTNLKPYVINGIKHYSIYILLVAYRQNTKVKSITFDEYYNEDFFNEIISSNDEFDKKLIENEIYTITLITEILTEILGKFDTAFITAYFKFSSIKNINEFNNVKDYFTKLNKHKEAFNIVEVREREIDWGWGFEIEKEISNIDLLAFIREQLENLTLFEFLNKDNQEKLKEIGLKKISSSEISSFINEYNKAVFYNSLGEFERYITGTKNGYLFGKYHHIFMLAKK